MFSKFVLVISTLSYLFSAVSAAKYEIANNFPPRYQWETNFGYCGEVSLIVSGMALGQYMSQFDSRAAACGSLSQAKCEMLLGVNDQTAATKMGLASTEYGTIKERSTNDFLVWVKQQVIKGQAVIIGVYMNYNTFYNDNSPSAGDSDYDHIVPVTGISSNHPLSATDSTYYADDVLTFSDNGLYTSHGLSGATYMFNYTFDDIQKSRIQANTKNGNVYALPNTASNYGIVITGLLDTNSETLPVRVDTDKNYETPEMKEGSNTRPDSMPLVLTVTVSSMQSGVKYNLYRYSSFETLPTSNFNSHAKDAAATYIISSTTGSYSMTLNINSDEIVFFRCVKA